MPNFGAAFSIEICGDSRKPHSQVALGIVVNVTICEAESVQRDPFAHSIFYLRRKREVGARGTHWAYAFHNSDGGLLLEAWFPEIPKEAIFFAPGKPESPLVRLKSWRWFWWNGRYDVVDEKSDTVLATLRRTGGIEGPDGRSTGRVRNPAPLRNSFMQLLFHGVLNSLFSSGNDSSALAVDEFRVEAGGLEVGTLRRVRLPFSKQTEVAEAANPGWLRRWLNRFRSTVRKHFDSGGWMLDFSADTTGALDPRVRVAAALFRIQIEERYN